MVISCIKFFSSSFFLKLMDQILTKIWRINQNNLCLTKPIFLCLTKLFRNIVSIDKDNKQVTFINMRIKALNANAEIRTKKQGPSILQILNVFNLHLVNLFLHQLANLGSLLILTTSNQRTLLLPVYVEQILLHKLWRRFLKWKKRRAMWIS